MPSAWVTRRIDDDYGVDLEVELFHSKQATGRIFKVQLKGTDSARPSRDVAMESLRYWRSLDVPVLVVLYHAPTGSLYCRWAHAHDPHRYPRRPPEVSTTFTFEVSETLTSENAATLAHDVEVHRSLWRGWLPRPVRVYVDVSSQRSAVETELLAELRDLTGLTSDLLRFDREERPSQLRVTLGSDRLTVQLPAGFAGMTMHFEPGTLDELPWRQVAVEVLVLIGFDIARVGAKSEACRITEGLLAQSLVIATSMEIALGVIDALVRENRVADLISTAVAMSTSPLADARHTGELFAGAALGRQGVSRKGLEALLDALTARKDIETAQDTSDEVIATIAYNCSLLAHSLGREADSLAFRDEALALNTDYGQRAYFHRERGGNLYSLGRFEEAAAAYQTAVSLGAGEEIAALAADSFSAAGQFRRAEAAIADIDASTTDYPLTTVLRVVLDIVRKVVDVDEQDRVALDDLPSELDPADLIDYLRRHDALDPRVWTRLLVELGTFSGQDEADAWLLVATRTNAPMAWATAITYALRAEPNSPRVPRIVDAALYRSGTSAVQTAIDELEPQLGESTAGRELVAQRAAQYEDARTHRDRVLGVRFAASDGQFEVRHFG